MRRAVPAHGLVLSFASAARRVPVWLVAAASLVAGFAVAQATGVRPLGGLVLVAGAGWCARRWRACAGAGRTVALLVVFLAAFVAAHLLADALGPWGAVLTMAAVVALAAAGLGERPAAAHASLPNTASTGRAGWVGHDDERSAL